MLDWQVDFWGIDKSTLNYINPIFRTFTNPTVFSTPVYLGRVKGVDFSWSLFSGGMLGGKTDPAIYTIRLDNRDGELDYFMDYNFINVFTGCRIAIGSTVLVFSGTVVQFTFGDEIVVQVQHFQDFTPRNIQPLKYAGTGGLEGEAELAGRWKPMTWGRVFNIEPISLIPAKLVYQYHSGAVGGPIGVYDGGAPLTYIRDFTNYSRFLSASVAPGKYISMNSNGLIRLGAPVGSVLTVTADGHKEGSTVLRDFGEILAKVASYGTSLTLDASSTPGTQLLGYFYDGKSELQAVDFLDELAKSSLSYYYVSELQPSPGIYLYSAVFNGAGTPVRSYGARDIFSISPAQVDFPLKRLTFEYARNWRPLAESEVLGAVPDATKAVITQPNLTYDLFQPVSWFPNNLAKEEVVKSYLYDATETATEVSRRMALFAADRRAFTVEVEVDYFVRVGDTVTVTYPRFQLASGRDLAVLQIEIDGVRERMKLELWG